MAAASTVVMLLVVTRVLGTYSAGVFALALTLGQQAQMLGAFEIRPFHATDVSARFSFGTYYSSRIVTTLLMVAGIAAFALVSKQLSYDALVLVLIASTRAFDAFEDVFHGELQRRGRLDLGGRAFFYRTLVTTVVFCGLVILTHSLLLASAVTLAVSLAALIALNVPVARAMFELRPDFAWGPLLHLLRVCAPLFAGGFLAVYLMSAPRFGIEQFLSPEDQARFVILFMPALVINLLSLVLFKPLLTRIATHWTEGDRPAFLAVVRKAFAAVAAAFAITFAISWAFGLPLLRLVYGVDLAGHEADLLVLVVGGGLNAVGVILYYALVTMRRQRAVLIGYCVAAAVVTALAWILIPRLGMLGAGLAYGGAMLVLALVLGFFFLAALRSEHDDDGAAADSVTPPPDA